MTPILLIGIIAISIAAIFVISPFVFRKTKNTDITDVKPAKNDSDGKIWTIVLCFVALAVILSVSIWVNNQKYIEAKPVIVENTSSGTMFWRKPANVMGDDPGLRTYSMKVFNVRNDAAVMSFTGMFKYNGVDCQANFYWDKRNEYGTWSQINPKGSGQFRFEQAKENSKAFVGEISNEGDGFIPAELLIG